jgi:Tfp pilus assembly protein PilN
MINLLTTADSQAVRAEYHRRLFVVVGLLSLSLILIINIVIGAFALILSWRRDEALARVAVAHREFTSEKLVTARRTTNEINTATKVLVAKPLAQPISTIYQHLIEKRLAGVQLTRLEFTATDGGQVSVDGQSTTRAAFLAYLEALRADPYFQRVESPVKNIIRERDISFNLTVFLAPTK